MLHATPTYTLRTEVISIVSEHLLCTIGGGNASGLIPDSIPNSSFELQTHRRYHSWTVQPSENTESARGTGRSMEALHEESRYALYRCHLLRECHALSDRCQAAVEMYRKGISDDVPGKPWTGHPSYEDKISWCQPVTTWPMWSNAVTPSASHP